MTRRLLLFANSFPYGKQEPYLMRECHYLDAFDEVYIFSLSIRKHQREHRRDLPLEQVTVVPVPFKSPLFYAAVSPRALVSRAFMTELRQLLRDRRFTVARAVQALSQFSRAEHEASVIGRFIRDNITPSASDETVFYAYRFLYQPYLMSRLAAKFPSSRRIGRAHGIDLFEERQPTDYLPGREINLRALDELHSVSRAGAEYLRARHPDFVEKIKVSHLGTEDHGVRPPRSSSQVLRLVSCSDAAPVKRLELLVEALREVSGTVQVEWSHYGDGPDMDRVRAMASTLPGHVSATFHGWTRNDEILEAYRSGRHDVFINVSSSEGLPVSIMESSSCGLPTIATDVGGTGEIVSDGVNGRLISANPMPREIASAVEEFARMTPDAFARRSAAARETWSTHFDSDRNYRQFVEKMLS